MAKKESERLTLHSVYLFEGDFAELGSIYGGDLSASKIIRTLVRRALLKVREKKAASSESLSSSLPSDIEAQLEDLQ